MNDVNKRKCQGNTHMLRWDRHKQALYTWASRSRHSHNKIRNQVLPLTGRLLKRDALCVPFSEYSVHLLTCRKHTFYMCSVSISIFCSTLSQFIDMLIPLCKKFSYTLSQTAPQCRKCSYTLYPRLALSSVPTHCPIDKMVICSRWVTHLWEDFLHLYRIYQNIAFTWQQIIFPFLIRRMFLMFQLDVHYS